MKINDKFVCEEVRPIMWKVYFFFFFSLFFFFFLKYVTRSSEISPMSEILISISRYPIFVCNSFCILFCHVNNLIHLCNKKLHWHGVFSFWQFSVSFLHLQPYVITHFGPKLKCDSFCLIGHIWISIHSKQTEMPLNLISSWKRREYKLVSLQYKSLWDLS